MTQTNQMTQKDPIFLTSNEFKLMESFAATAIIFFHLVSMFMTKSPFLRILMFHIIYHDIDLG